MGIRVFFYWVSVALAAWFVPAAAGLWSPDGGHHIPHVAIGIVTLGYILYGMMTHAALAAVGVGIAASDHLPLSGGRRGVACLGVGDFRCRGSGRYVAAQDRDPVSANSAVLDETIHQSVRLRIMTLLVSQPDPARVAYRFIQRTLDLTGGNLTIHLRKLREAGYVAITKEFHDEKPSTWIQATGLGRQAFADYLVNLEGVLKGVTIPEAPAKIPQSRPSRPSP